MHDIASQTVNKIVERDDSAPLGELSDLWLSGFSVECPSLTSPKLLQFSDGLVQIGFIVGWRLEHWLEGSILRKEGLLNFQVCQQFMFHQQTDDSVSLWFSERTQI